MSLGDMLNKMSPIENKLTRDMSQSEYMRLVDRNTELFDENKELQEEIERLNNIIDKALNYTTEQMKKYEGYDRGFEIVLSNIVVVLGSDKE